MFIAGFAFLFGFAAVWHILWLAVIGLLGVITSIIVRASDDHTEYTITPSEIKKREGATA